ncbi:MAG: DUF374 domain-containing protein [Rhodobacteraceae bacterium]|nr:DUF374 domain-containing protein [Paracoccaceae bacterium]
MSLRKRIADSDWLNGAVARLIAGYIRLVRATSSLDRVGYEPLDEAIRNGEATICTLWHDRLVLTPYMFPTDLGKMCSITSDARAGSMVGRIQLRFDFDTIRMSSHKRHVALSREVIGKIKQGTSIGIAVDGPRGPSRVAKPVPLVWARSTGKRIFLCTYAVRRAGRMPAWDRMLLPGLFNKGVVMSREFTTDIPRKMDEAQMDALRQQLEDEMNQLAADADAYIGFKG